MLSSKLLGVLIAVVSVLGGCGSYVIEGQVIRDGYPDISFVSSGEKVQSNNSIPAASISIFRDPDSLGREQVGTAKSRTDGTFNLTVDSFGAGFLEEKFSIRAVRNGYDDVEVTLRLPGSPGGKRLIVRMVPGASGGIHDEKQRILDQYEQFR